MEGDNSNSREVSQEAKRLSRDSDKQAAELAGRSVWRSAWRRTPVEARLPADALQREGRQERTDDFTMRFNQVLDSVVV